MKMRFVERVSVVIGMILMLIGESCTSSSLAPSPPNDKAEIVTLIRNTPAHSLSTWLKQFESNGNQYGCMLIYEAMGKHARHESRFTDALHCHEQAIELAEALHDTAVLAEQYNEMGTNYRRMGILDKATDNHYIALNLCEAYTQDSVRAIRKTRVKALNGIGNVCLTLKNYHSADSLLRLALAGERALGSDLGQAIDYANIGAIFDAQEQYDSARYYYLQSLECNERASSTVGKALCYIYLGHIYEKEGAYDKAIGEYLRVYREMADQIDRWHWLESSIALGHVYLLRGQYALAQRYLTESAKVASEIGSQEHLETIYKLQSDYYEALGQSAQALSYYKKSIALHNQLDSELNRNKLSNLQKRYERVLAQKKLAEHKAQLRMQKKTNRLLLLLFVIVSVLFVLLGIFSILYIRQKQKRQQMLEHLENVRTHFFTNITHEFRTPLTIILGLSEDLVQSGTSSADYFEKISLIYRQGENLLQLIDQLLHISKIKSEIGFEEKHHGDIVPYVRMICDNFRYEAHAKDIELSFHAQEPHLEIVFVADFVRKIVRNLLSNALKYTPKYGSVHVLFYREKHEIVLEVRDTGKGIEPEKLPHIFDLLYQAESSHSEVGMGVGLSLVKQIVDSQGGSIDVVSDYGKGSTFKVRLPYVEKDVNAKPLPHTLLEQLLLDDEPLDVATDVNVPVGVTDSEEALRLLIVEDNMEVAYYIGSQLQHKYMLFYAHNGVEGLKEANNIVPDLIMTDVMMPEMDGLTFCEHVRASEVLNHIPVIIITAKGQQDDRIKGLQAGADAYLVKPFSPLELHVRIESLIESRKMLRRKYGSSGELFDTAKPTYDKEEQFLHKFIDVTNVLMRKGSTDLDTLASAMCMSSRQLNRKIVALTGKTVVSYVIQIRLNKARHLLQSPNDLLISEVALQCGFEDGAYFSRVFKKAFQMPPTQYRKRSIST